MLHDPARQNRGAEGVSGLVYQPEIVAPITRRRHGKGFSYRDAQGKTIDDAATISRIKALAIPPAYKSVEIASNPDAHLQATGYDLRGRKQYRYHPAWAEHRGEAKFALLAAFGRALPKIRACVDADLSRKRIDDRKALATVVWLLDRLFIRVGNEAYRRDNGSFGATTLRNRHVRVEGSEVRFHFKGKSGKEWQLRHRDRRIVRAIRRLQELPGQALFQYRDADGILHPVRSQDVNAYIREAAGEAFTSRQFRTWAATRLAAAALANVTPAETVRERASQVNDAIDMVASQLRNTRAVCRNSYIHPLVFKAFDDGSLARLSSIRLSRRQDCRRWMDEDEIRVMTWLDHQTS